MLNTDGDIIVEESILVHTLNSVYRVDPIKTTKDDNANCYRATKMKSTNPPSEKDSAVRVGDTAEGCYLYLEVGHSMRLGLLRTSTVEKVCFVEPHH